jgi:hypothetical protein
MTCRICGGTGWEVSDEGASRCACMKTKLAPLLLSKRQLADLAIEATNSSEALSAIPGYPFDSRGRKEVADALMTMCSSPEEIRFVVKRAIALFKSWKDCAVPGLRAVLCSRYKTRDGIESQAIEAFPDGIPSERDGKTGYQQLEQGPKPKALPAAAANPAADEKILAETVRVAKAKSPPPAIPRTDDEFSRKLDELDRGYAVRGDR